MTPLLKLEHCTIRFGGLTAVSDLDLTIHHGDLVGLIGPNGAGKTTVFNLITGVYKPSSGQLSMEDRPLSGLYPHQITARGVARTFQNIRLFHSMTVFDNVRAVFHLHRHGDVRHALWRGATFFRQESQITSRVNELLDLFHLGGFRDQLATSLSYGDQRRLEIVRALATQPKLLLLDEPAAGMNATEKLELNRLIRHIRDSFSIAILLVEHDMQLVMDVCDRLVVLDHGVKLAEGSPLAIRHNPAVIAAYLGQDPSTASTLNA